MNLDKVRDSAELRGIHAKEIDQFLRKLVSGAKSIGRDPVKTDFTVEEKKAIERYFRDIKSGYREQSFVALSRLLGIPLSNKNWAKLFDANKVGGLTFLLGGDPVKPLQTQSDWQNKCFGLAEAKTGVFVVGLNDHFFKNVSSGELTSPVTRD